MPARIVKQNREIKELFRAKIREKVEREKERMRERIDSEVPSWIRWAVKPLAEWNFNAMRARWNVRGDSGETNAFLHFWLLMPNTWVVIEDAVIEPEQDEFAQIDHVLIGPPGIFLVETKAWEGAFLGYKDVWKRKEGNSWMRCESPTKQNLRHKQLFVEWLKGLNLNLSVSLSDYVFPVVLFTRCRWLKTEGCSMPVFRDGAELVGYLRRCAKEKTVLSQNQIEKVTQALANAKPLCSEFCVDRIERVRLSKGKECIRVFGPEERAEQLRGIYVARGKIVSKLFPDRHDAGWWCFYIER